MCELVQIGFLNDKTYLGSANGKDVQSMLGNHADAALLVTIFVVALDTGAR